MLPILFSWGPLVVPSWHLFYVLGALCAFIFLSQLSTKHCPEVRTNDIVALFVVCYVCGYFGARLLSIFIEEPQFKGPKSILSALFKFGPMTFYGGGILAFLAGWIVVRVKGLPFAKIFDCAIPSGLLALALGRIGCFLNGDDFGKAVPLDQLGTAPIWSVTFPNLGDNIARYPIQLVEAFIALGCALFLGFKIKSLRQSFFPGITGLLGLISYANFRFFLEFFRDDFRGSILGSWISTSQFISIMLLLISTLALPFLAKASSSEKI